MASITLDSLTVRFGPVVAVDDLSLTFDDGEFVVLLGPSGCGKTTTLRCIAGLEAPSDGRILFDGASVERLTPKARQVAMVFQFVSLYPHLNIRENIAFPLKARGERRAEVAKKVARIATTFDLTETLGRMPKSLPPGAWQKAALARAVVREPKVLLLDEPLSAIDEQFREEMRWELRHIQKELGTTTIHVTHDQREAMSLADRVVLMRDGRVVQEGPPAALYDDPADLFAAQFIGSPSMNLLPARIEQGVVFIEGQELTLPPDLAGRIRASSRTNRMTVGIRPHDVALDTEPLAEAAAAGSGAALALRSGETRVMPGLAVEVLSTSVIGRERLFDFRIGESSYRGVVPPGTDVAERGRIRLDPDRLLFFGADGRRIRV